MDKKIIDKTDRKVLNEGRNYQMGFGFLKKKSPTVYETVQPLSPCKDYLNDVVWSEATSKDISAHGLNYSKKDIFDGKAAYMAISILPYFGGQDYPNQAKDIKNLKENIDNLETFMNFFEKKLNLKVKTKIEETESNKYIVTFDHYWSSATYKISLYSLLLRVGQFYKGDKTPLKYLEKFSEFPVDTYMVLDALPKLKKLLSGTVVKQDLESLSGGYSVHNMGIVTFKF